MRSGSSTTCGCRISWSGTYYWGIPRGCWLPCGISQYCNPRTSWMDRTQLRPHSAAAILPSMRLSMAQAFHHGKEINRAEALAALLGGRRRALELAHHPMDRQCGGLEHPQERHGPFVAIPRPASATPLSDAPLAWQPTLGRCGGSRVCRIPRIGRAGRSWKPFTELGPKFSCLLMLLRSVSLKFQ